MSKTVQVNYEEMQNIIKNMKSEQAEVATLLRQTKSKVESLHNNQWVGEAADKFFSEMEGTVLPALNRLENALGTAAEVAQKAVNIIQQADEGTKRFFVAS